MATDTIFSDTPAIHDGSTMAQFFVGKDTWYVVPMESRASNNLSIHSMIISRQEELWIPLSHMVENMKLQRKLLTFSGAYS